MSLTSYQAAPPCNKGRSNVVPIEFSVNGFCSNFSALPETGCTSLAQKNGRIGQRYAQGDAKRGGPAVTYYRRPAGAEQKDQSRPDIRADRLFGAPPHEPHAGQIHH